MTGLPHTIVGRTESIISAWRGSLNHFIETMKIIKTLFLALALMPMALLAQSTRADLAKIRVEKDGNFQYWEKNSNAIDQLKKFVARVTDESSSDFVPVEDRIATFDVDGTLLCETAPFNMNCMMCLHRYLHDESFVVDADLRDAMQRFEDYILKKSNDPSAMSGVDMPLQMQGFRGMTQEEYSEFVCNFLDTVSPVGLSNLTWGTALYWPMIEVVSYLVANDFQVYLCSGSDRDMCRELVRDIYEIPANRILATDVHYVMEGQADEEIWTESLNSESYTYTPGEKLVRGEMKQLCTAINKIVIMSRELGKKPILSWGNSSGDYPMFHYTNLDNPLPHLSFCLLCDDLTRELGNTSKAEKCKAACEEYGWVPVSMKNEWTTIYGDDVAVTGITGVTSAKADTKKSTSIYNVSGQQITSPRSNEVYITDGKKMIK